jgi:hypothetical protein
VLRLESWREEEEADKRARAVRERKGDLPGGVLLSAKERGRGVIRLQRIHNFLCSMLVFTPFALCFVTLRGVFTRFPELTY